MKIFLNILVLVSLCFSYKTSSDTVGNGIRDYLLSLKLDLHGTADSSVRAFHAMTATNADAAMYASTVGSTYTTTYTNQLYHEIDPLHFGVAKDNLGNLTYNKIRVHG